MHCVPELTEAMDVDAATPRAEAGPGRRWATGSQALGHAGSRRTATPADAAARLAGARGARDRVRRRHELQVPLRPAAADLLDRLPARRRRGPGPARPLVLRPARVGGAARELHRHRQGRRADRTLVPARPPAHQRGGCLHAGLVERLDVRVPDAAAGACRAIPRRCSTSPAARGARADRVRAAARRAVGHLGVGLQRRGPARQLPVQGVRRARPGPQARARRRPGGRALRHGARRHGRPDAGRAELPPPGARGRRGDASASTRRSTTRTARCRTRDAATDLRAGMPRRAAPSCGPSSPTIRA